MPLIELVSYVLTLVGLFTILLFVGLKNTESKIYRAFLLFGLAVFLYSAASFCAELPESLNSALLLSRIALFFANFIPLFFFSFALSFTDSGIKYKKVTIAAFLLLPILSVLAFLPTTIAEVQRHQYGTILSQVGFGLWATLLYFVALFTISFSILYNHSKKSDAVVRAQIKLMSFGIGISVGVNMITQIVLPTFGQSSLGNVIGNPANVVLVGAVGLAILRHKMFDIRSVIFRSFGFVLMAVAITLCYSAIIFGTSKILFPDLKLNGLQQVYFVVVALILALTVRPLIRWIKKLTDKLFFRDEYDPQHLVNEMGRILASEIDLGALTDKVANLLQNQMHVKTVDIIVLDKEKIYFESSGVLHDNHEKVAYDLKQFTSSVYVKDNLPSGAQKATMEGYELAVIAPLVANNEKIGYLLFSEKSSGANYTTQDARLIEIASGQLAVAIHNSLSYALVRQFNTLLQQRVDHATQELQSLNKKLKDADEVKDDFISMASHQLTTPLAAIDGYLNMATKGYYGPVNDKLNHPLSSALARARVMKQLVVDLLTISKMTAGKFTIDQAPSDLNILVPTEVNGLELRAKENEVTLTYHAPSTPLPEAYIDEQKTRQAIINLIDNAIQYTPGGKVDVFLDRNLDKIIFKVVDNGIGVPESEKAKLFTKFFRAGNAKNERPDGTGIGLYLVKRVTDAQNGQIIFESSSKGSTFGFSLPIKHTTVPNQKV